ncbi:MAG: hypothetical protein AAF382_08720 [Pseudomonadota bacterium]
MEKTGLVRFLGLFSAVAGLIALAMTSASYGYYGVSQATGVSVVCLVIFILLRSTSGALAWDQNCLRPPAEDLSRHGG